MGQGQGMMGFYITLCTVHTTQGQGQGTMGFCMRLCTVHTAWDWEQERDH